MDDYNCGYKDGFSDGKMDGCQKFYEYLRTVFEDVRCNIKDDNFLNVGIEQALENACYNSGLRESLFQIWQQVEKYMNQPLEEGEE